jgi:putative transposase
MVSAPWEYAWSNAPAHFGVGDDPSVTLDLGWWFERMLTDAWKKTLLAIAASDETIARLRMYTRTGRPLGDESFLKRIEEAVERAIRAKSVGRPKGSKDKVKRKELKPKQPL